MCANKVSAPPTARGRRAKHVAVASQRTQNVYTCALCGPSRFSRKRNNIEQHIWYSHPDRHGGPAPLTKYRATLHKKYVTVLVTTIPEPLVDENSSQSNGATVATSSVVWSDERTLSGRRQSTSSQFAEDSDSVRVSSGTIRWDGNYWAPRHLPSSDFMAVSAQSTCSEWSAATTTVMGDYPRSAKWSDIAAHHIASASQGCLYESSGTSMQPGPIVMKQPYPLFSKGECSMSPPRTPVDSNRNRPSSPSTIFCASHVDLQYYASDERLHHSRQRANLTSDQIWRPF